MGLLIEDWQIAYVSFWIVLAFFIGWVFWAFHVIREWQEKIWKVIVLESDDADPSRLVKPILKRRLK